MILREQANIVMNKLNDILINTLEVENKLFYITDDYQNYQKYTEFDGTDYIAGLLRREEPFVPKSSSGLITDYLTIELYGDMTDRRIIESAVEIYRTRYHSKSDIEGTETFTQYVGKYQYLEDEFTGDGLNIQKFKSFFRIEWQTLLGGIPFDSTSVKIDGEIIPAVLYTYRNDKGTVANVNYTNKDNVNNNIEEWRQNPNLVSESLVLTIPLNNITGNTRLWKNINLRTFNQIFVIEDNSGLTTSVKEWELKSGIINREENKIVTFTAIFDIPLPRAEVSIRYRNNRLGLSEEGTVLITNFSEISQNTLDGRVSDGEVRGQEVRQVNGYGLNFIYESGNEIAKILAERSHKKIPDDRFDITYKFLDLEFEFNNLVLEKGTHGFTDEPGIVWNIVFNEGV